jgi:hypothetical protein
VCRYVPGIYWLAVVLISIVGTLITDNLTDNFGVSLVTTTVVFSVVLACVFAAWYASERTLSIHTIITTRRESFYWLTVLFTFALGTAAGDLTVVIYLSVTRVDIIEARIAVGHAASPAAVDVPPGARILVVANKIAATPALVEAVRARAADGAAEFVVLVPNPAHVAFDRNSPELREGDEVSRRRFRNSRKRRERRSRAGWRRARTPTTTSCRS